MSFMASHHFWDSLINHTQTHLLTTKQHRSKVPLLKPRIEAVTTGVCIHSHQALPCPQGAPSPPEPQGPPGGLPRLARPRGRPPREPGEAEREGSRAAVRDPITLGKMEPSARPPAEERQRGSLRSRLGEKTGLSHGNPGCREPHYGNRSSTQSRPFVSGDPGPMAARSGTNPSQSAPGLRHWGGGPTRGGARGA